MMMLATGDTTLPLPTAVNLQAPGELRWEQSTNEVKGVAPALPSQSEDPE
jgi:hypothetical protein